MSDKKIISFNAFEMNCAGHLSPGLWRYPGDQSIHYKDISYWQNLAQIAERGLFDAIFIADVLGVYDVYGGSDEAALRTGLQTPVNDPIQLAAVGAAVTEHLSFGITAGIPFEHPFPFARRLSTLDHLTKGRVGWNIVTGYLPSANKSMGQIEAPHDERYDQADEYLEVLYRLLEGSWEDDAVILDEKTGQFADPAKIHHIKHDGKYYKNIHGIHVSEPSPQRTPVLFQAGNSPRGITFAAQNAEAIFIAPPTKEHAKVQVERIRAALVAAGRRPTDAKIYILATVITDETDALAQAKFNDFLSYASEEGSLVLNSGWLGVDLSKYKLDEPLNNLQSNAMIAAIESLRDSVTDEGKVWTLRDLIRLSGIGCHGIKIVGGPQSASDAIEELIDFSGADGINLGYATTPGTHEDVVNFIVPELQKRGRYKTEYTPGTLRHKMFGQGDRLPENHRASKYRIGGELSVIDDITGTGRASKAQE